MTQMAVYCTQATGFLASDWLTSLVSHTNRLLSKQKGRLLCDKKIIKEPQHCRTAVQQLFFCHPHISVQEIKGDRVIDIGTLDATLIATPVIRIYRL